jgi:lysophospholipase L1-like esterase
MLVRMYPDVIDLKPAVMVLLAGTNDIARNTGPMTAEMIQNNIMAMTELAQRHGIKVILCSVLPVSDYPFLKQQSGQAAPPSGPGPAASRVRMTEGRPPADILKLNRWLSDYASRSNAMYVDYFTAVADEKGWLTDAYSGDGLHPNAQGYKIMAPIVAAAIQKALP